MSLLAVKNFVYTTLLTNQAAIVANTSHAAADVFRQMPKFDKLGSKVVVSLGTARGREARAADPRFDPATPGFAGRKEARWEIDIDIYSTHSDEFVGGDDNDTLIENVTRLLAKAPLLGGPIVDPKTGASSLLLELAENVITRVPPPYGMDSASPPLRVAWHAILTVLAVELITN